MSVITTEENDTLYVCPDCGSPSLEYSLLSGGTATCTACTWSGAKDRLLAIPVELRGKEETFAAMRNDLRNTFGRAATDFGRFLVKWGFLDATQGKDGINVNPRQLARYMTVIAKETFIAVLAERRKIEEERVSAS
jgi:hypothetical protein